MAGSISDITGRKRMDIQQQGRSKVLESLAHGKPLKDILSLLVATSEKVSPGMLGSVLLLDDDGKHLSHGAAPSLPDFYTQAVDGVAIGERVGSCGAAAFTRKLVIVENIMTHPYWNHFRDLAAKADLSACWSQPIMSVTGEVLGTFAMYYRQPRRPTQFDLDSIKTSAQLACVAIERSRAEEALRDSEERYRITVEGTQDLISIVGTDGRFKFVNHMARSIFGISAEDCIGLLAFDFIHSDDRDRTMETFHGWIENKETFVVHENRQVSRDGSVHHMLWNITVQQTLSAGGTA